MSYKDIHRAAGTHRSHQRVLIASSFISLTLPLIFFTALILKKIVQKKLGNLCHHTSNFDEYSPEQRPHSPHNSQVGYVKAECLI